MFHGTCQGPPMICMFVRSGSLQSTTPRYPYKCPKLKLAPGKSLAKTDADRLLSLLHEQENFDAREGRAMLFNLVEAAKEFLSEIVPVD
ncbi:eIF-2-alpha kinase GCN2 [Thalictrum thalictroides]|uniref:eIF-2-alpha kinase GCN2 n=1 Tax=Thalictrum thalictroides TaxID=46969 RepID=A0A7J6WSU0_THATH|nr:eIF-2-alpha kinase GCN2 [Thalictrum thalictroides]